ncbi:hypothetical protein AUJ46_04445 [Candidatus Peregrinibacteria bacterium CG1_02_54_53]|nr:MAG: hypothetical protein AUJ46_04445 [Candidatus Peregrinibacteria bacterium CG1_02_54_53]
MKIIKEKQPKAFFLENVRHLEKHNDGKTFETIRKILTEDLGYSFEHKIVKASDFGLPTHRPRLYMIGFRKDINPEGFSFPESIPLTMTMSDVLGGKCPKKIGFTLRVGGSGSGIHDRRNWDSYLVDGKARRITVEEGKMMMGFPENFVFPVSKAQALKQLGNSVAVSAIQVVGSGITNTLSYRVSYSRAERTFNRDSTMRLQTPVAA